MKTRILFLIFTACALTVLSQPSIVQTEFESDTNSIIRDWNQRYLIAYTRDNDSRSSFLLIDKTSNHIVAARLVDGYTVTDFDILDDKLYFVGRTRQQSGLMGYFSIDETFAQQDSIRYCLPDIASLPVRDDAMSSMAFFRNFSNMAVFHDHIGTTHVVFVGDEHVSTRYSEIRTESVDTRSLFDWVPGSPHFRRAYHAGGDEHYDDIIVSGDHLISVARIFPEAGAAASIAYRVFENMSSPLPTSRYSFSQNDNRSFGPVRLVECPAMGLDFGALYQGLPYEQVSRLVLDIYDFSSTTDHAPLQRRLSLSPDADTYRVIKEAAFVRNHKTICVLYGTGYPVNQVPSLVIQYDLRSFPFVPFHTDETHALTGSSITATTDEEDFVVSGNHVNVLDYCRDTLSSNSPCFEHPVLSLVRDATTFKTLENYGQLTVSLFNVYYRPSLPEVTEQDASIQCD
ncbi:MAG: hypothetical protein MJZ81_08415 [Bacteroidales bacterium]|nr:hypothetical protein [Bacteroidales bacterium]